MSAYCASIPTYDHTLSGHVPKPIATKLKEQKQRYGDSTTNTAQKFFTKRTTENTNPTQHPSQPEAQTKDNDQARAKEKREWEEMVTNFSEVFHKSSFYHHKPLQIRESSPKIPHPFPYQGVTQTYLFNPVPTPPSFKTLRDTQTHSFNKAPNIPIIINQPNRDSSPKKTQTRKKSMPTRIPLNSDQISPGLGLENIKDL